MTVLRPLRDADAAGVIALIGACWAEYPGMVFDVDAELPELRALATWFAARGGMAVVAEAAGAVVGLAGTLPRADVPGAWEIARVYVARPHRGSGLAAALLDAVEAQARAAGARELVLWTDTRFAAAHAFYEKRGWLREGPIRVLDDLSHSLEFRYARPLRGVVVKRLDAAAAASAERGLARILVDCVAAGASVSFLHPLPMETARGFWRGVAAGVARGSRILLAAWQDGALAGTATLVLDTPQNQPHRAELAKMLVHPAARRAGLGRALLAEAEAAAREAGRSLLTLDTCRGEAGEALYRAAGWTEAGVIPDFALYPDGRRLGATVLFWKRLIHPPEATGRGVAGEAGSAAGHLRSDGM